MKNATVYWTGGRATISWSEEQFREKMRMLYGRKGINVAPSRELGDGKKLYKAVQEKPHTLLSPSRETDQRVLW